MRRLYSHPLSCQCSTGRPRCITLLGIEFDFLTKPAKDTAPGAPETLSEEADRHSDKNFESKLETTGQGFWSWQGICWVPTWLAQRPAIGAWATGQRPECFRMRGWQAFGPPIPPILQHSSPAQCPVLLLPGFVPRGPPVAPWVPLEPLGPPWGPQGSCYVAGSGYLAGSCSIAGS